MNPRQTGVSIVRAASAGEVTTTELRLEDGEWPTEPLAPASVWTEEAGPAARKVIELHRLVRLADKRAAFESYGLERAPSPGGTYSLFAWFTPDQLRVLEDEQLRWKRRRYDGPDPDHDHCLLTWTKIKRGDDAYRSDAGWISVDAYERLVRDDLLRLRSPGSDERR